MSADLLDAQAAADAVADSEISYLVAGLEYDARVWQEQWPRVMRNTIDACERHNSALAFFDNVWPVVARRDEQGTHDRGRIRAHRLRAGRRPFALQVAPRWLLTLMGLFVPVLRENMDMLYQFERDYRFDSSKVEQALGLTATSYRDGIAATLKAEGV